MRYGLHLSILEKGYLVAEHIVVMLVVAHTAAWLLVKAGCTSHGLSKNHLRETLGVYEGLALTITSNFHGFHSTRGFDF